MCKVCGCGQDDEPTQGHAHDHGATHAHDHDHDHHHHHDHHDFSGGEVGVVVGGVDGRKLLTLEKDILAKNNRFAAANRAWLSSRRIFSLNLISSPGSGKTTLLAETLRRLAARRPVAAVIGDQKTSRDADRVRQSGVKAIQINTGKGCHLDAHMVGHTLEDAGLSAGGVLFIENVGNLVCPAGFDLGESKRVVLLSVTEGEDKPLKYPDAFRTSDLLLLTKVDLLPHLDFNADECVTFAQQVNPRIEVLEVSAKDGQGLGEWLAWIDRHAFPVP
ncbi:MAG: hydrogenase nickel incorporation protein HypB [Deltaproteobacteria bacterium]|nr:hydrogenase nickel incorporation protein HypB [Deltaproteobacteria bacterium]